MELTQIQTDLEQILSDILEQYEGYIQPEDLFVVGCSTSEVMGAHIGKGSNAEVGEVIIDSIIKALAPYRLHLCVQCCEHLNRAVVIEREQALKHGFEIVNVVPAMHAGGSAAVAAMSAMEDPVLVEHVVAQCGLDIGDTFIGMHVKHVQVPVRPSLKTLGAAHVTALKSRPKYIGGPRAQYQ